MLALVEYLSRNFMLSEPNVSIYLEGGGTAIGIQSLIDKSADICIASRSLQSDEIKLLADKTGTIGLSYLIAKDAIGIYLHPANEIKTLAIKRLRDIYTGRIKNWSEIGGKDAPIKLVGRSPNSGTYLYFSEHILLGEPFYHSILIKHNTQSIVEEVSNNQNSIGYGCISQYYGIYLCKIEGIEATEENVRNDKYPITRYLYFYILNTPTGSLKKFIDWTISPLGQKSIREARYIPLWDIEQKIKY